MAFKIIVKKRFTNKLIKLLYYLEAEWGKPVADRFVDKLEKRLDSLSQQPFTGAESEYFKNVRSILITRHNRLYYRIKESTIEVINLYDTRMNPKRNPYLKK
ncbi:MAG: type II toxin-antitoxin system RelE/ParE family toxin [Chitinophagaceae bacterium]|nr:type II toxin-antitoxin system RelE/ParE family toxin [Chitinophagaceae bacterium]